MPLQELTLDNETAVRLVDRLKEFAAEYGATGRGIYILYEDKLIHEAQIARDVRLLPKILNRHGKLTKIELPFVADRIETKTNARIFGFKGRRGIVATVKILMRHSGRSFATRDFGNSLFADIHARRLAAPGLKRAGPIFAPQVYDYDRKRGRWIVEEFVPGKRAKRHDIVRYAPFIDLEKLYGKSTRMKRVLRRRSTRKFAEWLKALDPEFPQPSEEDVWPEGLIHSDLRGNMWCSADGRLCLIDWELARIAPVANDLVSIYFLNPDLKRFVFEWLRRLDPEKKAIAPEIQLGLTLMRYASDLMENPPQYVADLMADNRMGHAEALAQYEEDKAGVRNFLNFLRTP
jgi:hypothetical protein